MRSSGKKESGGEDSPGHWRARMSLSSIKIRRNGTDLECDAGFNSAVLIG